MHILLKINTNLLLWALKFDYLGDKITMVYYPQIKKRREIMKKVLSILLSVLLLMGTCTVLTSVIASAATAKAEAGGFATVDGNTFVATPYYGNSFAGWYNAGRSTRFI